MNVAELFFGLLLAVTLGGIASYFVYRQFQTRRVIALDTAMPLEERGFLVRQTRRRLICSLLMFLFAGLLVGWFFIEPNVRDLKLAEERAPGNTNHVVELVAYYWITALLLLFAILALAGLDFFATARFGLSQKKLLESEKRAALEVDAARLRKDRNGA